MKFKERAEGLPVMREGVHFEEAELCAIDRAFENPKNMLALDEFRTSFPDAYTSSGTKFFKDTVGMSIDYPRFRNFLVGMKGILRHELENLSDENAKKLPTCKHSSADHVKALDLVMSKLESASRFDN